MREPLVDSHCHLPLLDLDPVGGCLEPILQAARDQGVDHMLCVSVDLESYPALLAMVRPLAQVYASVGVHPNSRGGEEPTVERLLNLAVDPKVVAIGETGLDYFRSSGDLGWQHQRFRTHIAAAKAVGKPLIIHCREAREDVLRILEEEGAQEVGGVMHCFVEDWDTARRAMALNFYISFSGIVTFKNATELEDVARRVPLEWLLVETDAPYLAPVPHRGRPNQPAYVRHVAEHIAELKGLEPAVVARATTENFFRLFKSAG